MTIVTPKGGLPSTCELLETTADVRGKSPDGNKCYSKPGLLLGKTVKETLDDAAETCCPGGKSACDDSLFSGPAPPPAAEENNLCHPVTSAAPRDTSFTPKGDLIPTTCGLLETTTDVSGKPLDREKCYSKPILLLGKTVKEKLDDAAKTCCPGGKSACDDSLFSGPAPPPGVEKNNLCHPVTSAASSGTSFTQKGSIIPTTCGLLETTADVSEKSPDRDKCYSKPGFLLGKSVKETLDDAAETCCPGGKSACDDSLFPGPAPPPPPPRESNLCHPVSSGAPKDTWVTLGVVPTSCEALETTWGISDKKPDKNKCACKDLLGQNTLKKTLSDAEKTCCPGGKSACDDSIFSSSAAAECPDGDGDNPLKDILDEVSENSDGENPLEALFGGDEEKDGAKETTPVETDHEFASSLSLVCIALIFAMV